MKELLTGLHRRDCLRGYKSNIYRAGPIWQHFLNKKTSQNRFQEQPNLLLVIQSDFRISFWKSPDISKVLKDCWSTLFGCMGSFHCLVFTILHGHWYHTSRTKQIRQNTLQRGDLCGEPICSVEVSFVDARWPKWNTLISFTFVFVTFTHHHLPSFPVISKLIIQNVLYLSLTIHHPTPELFLKGTFCHFFQQFPGHICSIASDPIHKNSWTETSSFGRFQHGRPTMHLFPMSSCSASSMQHAVEYPRNVSKRMWKSRPKS